MINIKDLIKNNKKKVICGVGAVILLVGGVFLGNKIHCDIVLGMLKKGDIYVRHLKEPSNWIEEVKYNYVVDKYIEYDKLQKEIKKEQEETEKRLQEEAEAEYYRRNPEKLIEVVEKSLAGRKLKVKVKNNSNKTTSYIRIDVYFFDDNGNNLGSDWTNTSKKILSGGTLEISSDYIDTPEGTTKFNVAVSDVSFD